MNRKQLAKTLKGVPAFCPGYNLRRAEKTVSRWFVEAFRPASITSGQYALLLNLALESPLSTGELARRLNSELSTISRNMDAAEESGMVIRVDGTDKRRREYELTDNGWHALEENLPYWKEAQARSVRRLGRARWLIALGILKTLYDDY